MSEFWLLIIKTAVRGNSTGLGMPYPHKSGLYLQLVVSVYTWVWQKPFRKNMSFSFTKKAKKDTLNNLNVQCFFFDLICCFAQKMP